MLDSGHRRLDITRALAIPGWMSEEELLWLAEMGSQSLFAVEIGTYLGRSARAILDNMKEGSFLICIDPFQDCEGVEQDREKWSVMAQEWRKNLSEHLDSRVMLWIDTSESVANRWAASSVLDFVFIDGDHSYKSVKQDIELWLPKVVSGGVLAGHDYGVWQGVTKAVDELFSETRVKIEHVGSIWFVRK